MPSNQETCQLCNKEKFKYTCPKCSALYCSVECYKSEGHLKCSEEFYKNCVQEELSSGVPKTKEDMQKIYDILKRIRESDAGVDPKNFDNLDSDDDDNDNLDPDVDDENAEDEVEQENELDIATRLQNVDINDADKVWELLTPSEQEEFQNLVDTGDIMKLLPEYKPWWSKGEKSKIVDLSVEKKKEETENCIPDICANIPEFAKICSKQPSPCVHYNIWNIISAYACTVRFFAGEHLLSPGEAAAHLINLSQTLKYDTNFEDVEDAIISVEMEALTTGNAATTLTANKTPWIGSDRKLALLECREQLQNDARKLMSSDHLKLAALSDILKLLQLAKQSYKSSKAESADFQKLFALCSGSIELNPKKISLLIKKAEFLLSYAISGSSI